MASAAADYALEEKEQVHEAARILKVPEVVLAIEALVSLEEAANNLRLTIL